MTEPMQDISLLQLTTIIESELEVNLERFYWIKAEISEVRTDQKGHCYITFIEKDASTGHIAARMSAHCWNFKFKQIHHDFIAATKTPLAVGQKILVCAEVEMHSIYGLSLNILDIDADYTLGELQRQRQQTIERLKATGMFNANRQLKLSAIPNRIAVISSDKAAGYGDFIKQLTQNQWGFKFKTTLYPAIMQGENAAQSIVKALERINEDIELFDCAVIIRGGGATSDLNCFDDFELAAAVMNFPIPVITGIGHDRDISVTDMVAYQQIKTPTAVAEWIISLIEQQYTVVSNIESSLQQALRQATEREKNKLYILRQQIKHMLEIKRQNIGNNFKQSIQQIQFALATQLKLQHQKLNLMQQQIELYNPDNIFKMGYSIIKQKGNIIFSANDLAKGSKITALFPDQSKAELEVI